MSEVWSSSRQVELEAVRWIGGLVLKAEAQPSSRAVPRVGGGVHELGTARHMGQLEAGRRLPRADGAQPHELGTPGRDPNHPRASQGIDRARGSGLSWEGRPRLRHAMGCTALGGGAGVHSVDVKFEKGEITVKGAIDAKKIHARLQKWSKKNVELISETKSKEELKAKEAIKKITMKAYLHCDQCEREARRRLLMHKGIHNVKTDIKAQTITVEGVIEQEKLIKYMRERVHKYGEIVQEKKEEKKETVKVEVKSGGGGDKVVEEFKEVKKVEVKTKEGEAPYFIHYVYAPQLFSDENPNACSIL
ncbi:Heavy metal-associated isoprenylated plant protein 4 [Sesamum alatum]|uniref:Heavy metal-associated isoprenylated plant protein 4 n=1 Tax=Sesamum alatum TaxID=300844 RepID=A0AAE1XR76_9LAMI|nr:Heavy metal-associated isoprenylated plant protein 4 [Sesamum alatum]